MDPNPFGDSGISTQVQRYKGGFDVLETIGVVYTERLRFAAARGGNARIASDG